MELEAAVENFINLLQERDNEENKSWYAYSFEKAGSRVKQWCFRVIRKVNSENVDHSSVYCFIDRDGNILYPATYSSATKSSPRRGNILNEDPLKGTGIWGISHKK